MWETRDASAKRIRQSTLMSSSTRRRSIFWRRYRYPCRMVGNWNSSSSEPSNLCSIHIPTNYVNWYNIPTVGFAVGRTLPGDCRLWWYELGAAGSGTVIILACLWYVYALRMWLSSRRVSNERWRLGGDEVEAYLPSALHLHNIPTLATSWVTAEVWLSLLPSSASPMFLILYLSVCLETLYHNSYVRSTGTHWMSPDVPTLAIIVTHLIYGPSEF